MAKVTVKFKGINGSGVTIGFEGRDYRFEIGKNEIDADDWRRLARKPERGVKAGPLHRYVRRGVFSLTQKLPDDEVVDVKAVELPKATSDSGALLKKDREIEALKRLLKAEQAKLRALETEPKATPVVHVPDEDEGPEGEDEEDTESSEVHVVPKIDAGRLPANDARRLIAEATELTLDDLAAIEASEKARKAPRETVLKAIEEKGIQLMEAAEAKAS